VFVSPCTKQEEKHKRETEDKEDIKNGILPIPFATNIAHPHKQTQGGNKQQPGNKHTKRVHNFSEELSYVRIPALVVFVHTIKFNSSRVHKFTRFGKVQNVQPSLWWHQLTRHLMNAATCELF
jgi:hypothetical protein